MTLDPPDSPIVTVELAEHDVAVRSDAGAVLYVPLPPWLDRAWATRGRQKLVLVRETLTLAEARRLPGGDARVMLPDPQHPGRSLEVVILPLPGRLEILLAERDGRRVLVFSETITLRRSREIAAEFLAGMVRPRRLAAVTA